MYELATYRPHDPGHDYYEPGVYLITLVTRGREPLFGRLNDDIKEPAVELSEIGLAVMECWTRIPYFQACKNRQVKVFNAVCMPDHFHGVIEVVEKMDVSVGEVIRGFKAGCTMAWRNSQRPSMGIETSQPLESQPYLDETKEREMLKNMSKKQRAEYYAQKPREERPLFDDNYDDTICFPAEVDRTEHERHLTAMLHYVDDNPRRAIIRRARPDFMRRCLHVIIDGRDYAAFGNLFLLRWARKTQVMCHRLARRGMLTDEEWQKATASMDTIRAFESHARTHKLGHFDRDWYRSTHPDTITPIDYTRTVAYRQEHDSWVAQVMAGQTVIVTPGISKGELLMKDECLEKGYPLIQLQKEPIGRFWKPEARRFEACAQGSLLILAPWEPGAMGDVNGISQTTNYAIFHNLNSLAEELCLFNGEARIVGV